MSHFSLSIIVPCFDEQAVIVDTYNEINDVLSANNFDIEIRNDLISFQKTYVNFLRTN